MAAALKDDPWLAGDKFSLAECALIPYVRRLEDLSLSWLWEDDPQRDSLTDWYQRCKSQPSFKIAIEDIESEKTVELMHSCGMTIRAQVEEILHAA